jgi:hypothetical protein
MEELQVLTSLADEDFIAQIAFGDAVGELKSAAQRIHAQVLEGELQPPATTHLETRSRSLVTRVNDQDQLYAVESGALDLVFGPDQTVRLDRGDVMIVRRQRLYGTAIVAEESCYRVYDLGDYQSW